MPKIAEINISITPLPLISLEKYF